MEVLTDVDVQEPKEQIACRSFLIADQYTTDGGEVFVGHDLGVIQPQILNINH